MLTKFLRTHTSDDLELQGLLFEPKKRKDGSEEKKAVLHIHGLAGNFYENRFIDEMAEKYTNIGFSFLTVNTRGHDYVSDIRGDRDEFPFYVRLGGAHELFNEGLRDIEAWISYLDKEGYTEIVLQGHSAGTIKITMYSLQKNDPRVKGLILLSPWDVQGMLIATRGKKKQIEALEYAKKQITEDKGEQLLPEGYFDYPIDAKVFNYFFDDQSECNIFNFLEQDKPLNQLNNLKIPVFALFGTINESVPLDTKVALEKMKQIIPNCRTAILEHATHSYLGHEEKLAQEVATWLEKQQF